MASGDPNPFAAVDPALGYLYQVRLALLWALIRLRDNTDFLVSLEILDDVAFEHPGQPEELLQAKHHRKRAANLTDASPDLWKSLRVWLGAIENHSITPTSTLYLLTTANAAGGSIAAKLRQTDRDVDAALASLESTARTSQNQANNAAYAAFLAASAEDRRALANSIVVLDAAPDIKDLDEKIRAELFWVVERKHQNTFREYLEGWWFRRSVSHLEKGSSDRILARELDAKIADLRDQFKQDALPIADDLLDFTADEALYAANAESIFVQQIELTQAGKKRILAAVRDYYRAFEQRSRWLRDDLLIVGDLDEYERRLIEDWELVFEAIKDNLGAAVANAAKEKAARLVLEWAEQTTIPIRPAVTEPFVTRGSLHMLADELRVGWHCEFRDRLAHLLSANAKTV
jgi:hypothetical protein